MIGFMTFLTDFADQAVILPMVLAVAICLAARGWSRGAVVFLGAVGITFSVVLALKLGFLACQPVFGPWDIRSPSGHTAAAALFAGGVTALLTRRLGFVVLVAGIAAAAIGLSRVVLGFHSVPEVLLGGLAGATGAALLSRVTGPLPPRRPVSLLAVVSVVAVLLHGIRLPAEAAIWHVSGGALDFVPACRSGDDRQVRP